MIVARAKADGDDDEILLFGLTRGNITRLVGGEPIRITATSHGGGVPEGWKVLLVFGETEEAISDALMRSGAVGPDTEVRALPHQGGRRVDGFAMDEEGRPITMTDDQVVTRIEAAFDHPDSHLFMVLFELHDELHCKVMAPPTHQTLEVLEGLVAQLRKVVEGH